MLQARHAAVLLLAGAAGPARAAGPSPNPATSRSVTFVPYKDTWASARERWWDVGSIRDPSSGTDHYNQYNDWLTSGAPNGKFDYASPSQGRQLTFTYDQAPSVPYFVCHIHAVALKPNFAYQVKLTGKPVAGPRGFGTATSYVTAANKTSSAAASMHRVNGTAVNGDDWSNQQLGYAGRWWNDSNASGNTNAVTDSVYQANTTDTIYGYIFLGDFVTDAQGNCDQDFVGSGSYHITWQDWQNSGAVDTAFSPYTISGYLNQTYYGYGAFAPSSNDAVHQENGQQGAHRFLYEYESSRPHQVVLAPGDYHCRVLITEETFHNMYGATNNVLGGVWKTVLATEDFDSAGNPDTDPANDIAFNIGGNHPPVGVWSARDMATGPDNLMRVLWANTDGRAALWLVDASGNLAVNNTYGPYSGWSPTSLAVGGDNLMRVLWTRTDGAVALWQVASGDQSTGGGGLDLNWTYGPFPQWQASAVAAGPDNKFRVLWLNNGGTCALWQLNSDGGLEINNTYGPFGHWSATSLGVGPDNKMRVLWSKDDGTAATWAVGSGDQSGGGGLIESNLTYGPYPSWTARRIAAAADNNLRVLWTKPDGTVALWLIGSDGTLAVNNTYGAYPHWSAISLSAGSDNKMRVLWTHSDGRAALWQVASGDQPDGGSLEVNLTCGPY